MRNICIMIAASAAIPAALLLLTIFKLDLLDPTVHHLAVVMGLVVFFAALCKASVHIWRLGH